MATLVAFCENPKCGAIFQAPRLVGGRVHAKIRLEGTKVYPCPECGGLGLIPDGIYEYISGAITFLSGPDASAEQLEKVKAILGSPLAEQKTKEEVLSEIRRESPEVASFLAKLGGLNNVVQWLALLVALIGVAIDIHTSYFNSSKPDKDKVIEYLLEQLQRQNEAKRDAPAEKPVPRNAPCPCGSGKKYKHCCGRLA